MIALEEIDVATRGRAWLESLAGRRVTVVGLAKSGIAAARLLRDGRRRGDRRWTPSPSTRSAARWRRCADAGVRF